VRRLHSRLPRPGADAPSTPDPHARPDHDER